MTGGPGMGGDSFTNYGTGRAGPHGSSANDGPPRPASKQIGGVGSTAVLVVAVILLLVFLAAVFLF